MIERYSSFDCRLPNVTKFLVVSPRDPKYSSLVSLVLGMSTLDIQRESPFRLLGHMYILGPENPGEVSIQSAEVSNRTDHPADLLLSGKCNSLLHPRDD